MLDIGVTKLAIIGAIALVVIGPERLPGVARMAGTLLAAVNRGYDVAWLDELPARVNALTTEQVNAAIKKHLKPETMVLVKAGTFGAAAAPAK